MDESGDEHHEALDGTLAQDRVNSISLSLVPLRSLCVTYRKGVGSNEFHGP